MMNSAMLDQAPEMNDREVAMAYRPIRIQSPSSVPSDLRVVPSPSHNPDLEAAMHGKPASFFPAPSGIDPRFW